MILHGGAVDVVRALGWDGSDGRAASAAQSGDTGSSARAVARPAGQSGPERYLTWAASYDVQPDGSVRVTEDFLLLPPGGEAPVTERFERRIAMDRADAVQVLEAAVADRPLTAGLDAPGGFTVREEDDHVLASLNVGGASPPARRFLLGYVLLGAIRVGTDADGFRDTVIPSDRAPIDRAVITIALPQQVPAVRDATARRITAGGATTDVPPRQVDGRTLRIRADDLRTDERLEVDVAWAPDLVQATPAAWQRGSDDGGIGEGRSETDGVEPSNREPALALGELARAGGGGLSELTRLPAAERFGINVVLVLLALLITFGGVVGVLALPWQGSLESSTAGRDDSVERGLGRAGPGGGGDVSDDQAPDAGPDRFATRGTAAAMLILAAVMTLGSFALMALGLVAAMCVPASIAMVAMALLVHRRGGHGVD